MTDKKTEDGFLSRWSRRKLEGKAGRDGDAGRDPGKDAPAAEAAPPPGPAGPDREKAAEDSGAPELTEADVDKLEPGSDYTVFMNKGVSAHIQRLALRKLWLSDPVLANLDGLVDYADDYRGLADAGKVATRWNFGKGLLSRGKDAAEGAGPEAARASEGEAAGAPAEAAEQGEETEKSASDPAPDERDDAEKA